MGSWEALMFSKLISLVQHSYAEKTIVGAKPEDKQKWELTRPVPYQEGKSMEDFIGKTPDVHYIYVCTKVSPLCYLTYFLRSFNISVF